MIFLIILIILMLGPLRRFLFTILPKIPQFIYIKIIDIINYYKLKLYTRFDEFGLYIYVGLFGKGKTISAVWHAYRLCERYPDVKIYTNIRLMNFPLHTEIIQLTNYNQIIEARGDCIFLIDEISSLFQARNWAEFPPALLGQLLQCRKQHKFIIGTAQRFEHCDKLLRDITHTVIDCNTIFKRWTFNRFYDAYDWNNRNIMNIPIPYDFYNFIQTDEIRELYDTEQLINDMQKQEFLSNEEILNRQGDTTNIYVNNNNKKKRGLL